MKKITTLGRGQRAPLNLSRIFAAIVLFVLFLVLPPKTFATSDNCPDWVSYNSTTKRFNFHYNVGIPKDGNGDSPYTKIELEISGGKGAGNTYFVTIISKSGNDIVTDDASGAIDGTSEVKYVGSQKHRITYFNGSKDLNRESGNKYIQHCYGTIALPVTWFDYGATIEGFTNVVNWSTATELNNDRFEIERTIDGRFFTTIGTVKGAGNSSQNKNYQFIDNAPITGCAYRIKQVDFDGKFDYSKIIMPKKESTFNSTKPEVVICPNPASIFSSITIDLKNLGPYDNKVSVIDTYGGLIFEEILDSKKTFLNLENLNQGLYIVSIYNGDNIISKKIIVK